MMGAVPVRECGSEAACARLRQLPAGQGVVVAQLGQSLDGRIATLTGESRWINRDGALDHVHRLRASVDAVVVGIGTLVADDPMLNVRRVPGRNPARVVIDPNGRLPPAGRWLADDGARRIVIRAGDGPVPEGVETIQVQRENGQLDPNAIVAALACAGMPRLMIEGGARTVSSFLDAGALDRIHVLVAPVIIGSGKTGIDLVPVGRLADALRPSATVSVLGDGDVLFDCDLRTSDGRLARNA